MSDNFPNFANVSPLDRVRMEKGTQELKASFGRLAGSDIEKALEHINHENLHFSTLYLLRPDIDKYGIYSRLSPRNQKAVEITDGISARKVSDVGRLTRDGGPSVHQVLKWVFETGCRDDGLDNSYDAILERTAAIMVKTYKDASILQDMADMIFNRNRKGLFIHDLVWAFFEARVPYSLVLIANRLLSTDRRDVALALKLLRFIPFMENIDETGASGYYSNVLRWLEDNFPFLMYTGEGFHQTGDPLPYTISLTAKYLCKPISAENGQPLQPLDEFEKILAGRFCKLDKNTRAFLSGFSCYLYRRNYYQWRTWTRYPVDVQLNVARMAGGRND